MNKIRFMSIVAAIMIASVGMVGCKDKSAPANSDDGEAVVTTTTTELVVTMPTTTTVTEPTTTTTVTTTTEATTTTKKAKVTTTTKKAKVTTTTKATKKAKVTTTTKATKKKGENNLSVGGGTKPKGNTNLKTPDGQPVKKEGGEYFQWAPDLNMWIPYDPDQVIEKGGGEVWDGDGKGLGDIIPGAH